MKQQPSESTPLATQYEVRCFQCDTSFAKGTRRCIHCGGRLGGMPGLVLHGEEIPGEIDGEIPPTPGRALVWVMTAILALVGTLLRLCGG